MIPSPVRVLAAALPLILWTTPSGAQPAFQPANPDTELDEDALVEEDEGTGVEEAPEEEPGFTEGEEVEDWEMSDEELEALLAGEEAAPGEAEEDAGGGAGFLSTVKSKLDYRGYFESDLRSTVPGKDAPGLMDDFTFVRSDNTFRIRLDFDISEKTRAVGDFELIFTGMAVGDGFSDLTLRQKIDPFRIESDALYLQITELLPGLDIRLGRQAIVWGTADMFNPTSNLNALDLEDPLLFGDQIANEMIALTWAPYFAVEGRKMTVFEELAISLVFIPIFRPAQLPFWTVEAMEDPALFRQQVHAAQMFSLLDLQELFVSKGGELDFDIRYRKPRLSILNVQGAVKLSWILLGVDMSVSYFNGFDDMPRAERVYANDIYLPGGLPLLEAGDGMYELLEKKDDLAGATVLNDIVLSYPRMQVLGFDFSTSLDFLGGLGVWGEVAFYFHDDLYMQVRTSSAHISSGGVWQEVPGIERNYMITDYEEGWFWKGTFGVDYTITPWWYVNAQYVHGFPDEFGETNVRDYLVAGMDFKPLDGKILVRLFGIVSFPYEQLLCERAGGEQRCSSDDKEASAILYPALTFNFWRGTEITLGSLVYVGGFDTRFGSPLSGPNIVFLKGRISI
jgi:hypothetical protein